MFSKINRKYILQISVAIISCILFSNCAKQKTIENFVYEGFMFDSVGGAPSVGVQIALDACVPNDGRYYCDIVHISKTTTDANGYFKITGNPASSNKYTIVYIRNQYYNLQEKDFKDPKYTTLYIYHH
jgi:hypothetical protein